MVPKPVPSQTFCSAREERKDYAREAAIKVADSLQDPMCIAPAGRKEDTRALSLAGCKREHPVRGCDGAN
jgi:hypothetical protein